MSERNEDFEGKAQRIFFVKKANWQLAKRMAARSVFLFLLTLVGFHVADLMIDSARFNTIPALRRFPDFVIMMTAAAKFTFIELSLFWIRFGVTPKQDVQDVAETAARGGGMPAAVVHVTNTLVWAFRVVVFLYLVSAG